MCESSSREEYVLDVFWNGRLYGEAGIVGTGVNKSPSTSPYIHKENGKNKLWSSYNKSSYNEFKKAHKTERGQTSGSCNTWMIL